MTTFKFQAPSEADQALLQASAKLVNFDLAKRTMMVEFDYQTAPGNTSEKHAAVMRHIGLGTQHLHVEADEQHIFDMVVDPHPHRGKGVSMSGPLTSIPMGLVVRYTIQASTRD